MHLNIYPPSVARKRKGSSEDNHEHNITAHDKENVQADTPTQFIDCDILKYEVKEEIQENHVLPEDPLSLDQVAEKVSHDLDDENSKMENEGVKEEIEEL